jgi:hypothetical protein
MEAVAPGTTTHTESDAWWIMLVLSPQEACRTPAQWSTETPGECWYPGDIENENLLSRHARTTFSSAIARFCLVHNLGPYPNDMYMWAGLHAAAAPFANRSGQNSLASGPQASMSRCSTEMATWMMVPRGTSTLPRLMPVRASCMISDPGGYNRRVSCITIVSFKRFF